MYVSEQSISWQTFDDCVLVLDIFVSGVLGTTQDCPSETLSIFKRFSFL